MPYSDSDDNETMVSRGAKKAYSYDSGETRASGSPQGEGYAPPYRQEPAGRNNETMVRPTGPAINSVAWLYCTKGQRRGQLYQFRKQRSELGRSPECDIYVEDDFAGNHHGAVLLEEGAWRLFDFASKNGTNHNGKRLGVDVSNPVELNDGDVIAIGDTEMVFKKI